MLVLSRKLDQSIVIGDDITVTVVAFVGDKVRIGIVAPKDVPVHRKEVKEAIDLATAAGVELDPGAIKDLQRARARGIDRGPGGPP